MHGHPFKTLLSGDSPVVLDSYLSGAVECDVDALCDGANVHVSGIMQHIEEAGVHSGDSACSLPPHSLSKEITDALIEQTEALAKALNVVGLMNVQFAVKDNEIYLIEVNPRASRTVPFVAKATDSAIASIAARLMAGEPLTNFPKREPYRDVSYDVTIPSADPMTLADPMLPWFSVKEAVMPFARFPGVDTILGPEMRSTGEVMGWDRNFGRAFLKAQMGAGMDLPKSGKVFFSIKDDDKTDEMKEAATNLVELGFQIVATSGTSKWLSGVGIPCEKVNKVYEGRPNIVDHLKNAEIKLVINTTEGTQSINDSREIRSVALFDKIPYFTTAAAVGEKVKEKICDFLHESVTRQEETRLLQLDALYCVLKELSCQNHHQIPTNRRIDVKARQQIGQFFLCKEEQQLDFLRSLITSDLKIITPSRRWTNISSDIRNLVHSYPDNHFTGRSVARIFQGIESPRYPALTYGRDRRFWRQYIDVDFNELRLFAVRELARFK